MIFLRYADVAFLDGKLKTIQPCPRLQESSQDDEQSRHTTRSSPSQQVLFVDSKAHTTDLSTFSDSRKMDDSDDGYDFRSFRRQPIASPLTLISFYDGSGTDGRGRTLAQILDWDADKLESRHDYIQTLFPLPEESGINDRAPIIDKEVFDAFRSRPELRLRLRDAFEKMLWFYGFELITSETGTPSVRPGPNIDAHSDLWNHPSDHNHLRITRVIRCLRVLGLEDEARAFYTTMSLAGAVSARSRLFWRRAAGRQLNIAPSIGDGQADPEDGRIGVRWLFEYERERAEAERVEAERVEAEQHDAEEALDPSGGGDREEGGNLSCKVTQGNNDTNSDDQEEAMKMELSGTEDATSSSPSPDVEEDDAHQPIGMLPATAEEPAQKTQS